jgi:hypothetical protein
MLHGIDLPALGYECETHAAGGRAAAHVMIKKGRARALPLIECGVMRVLRRRDDGVVDEDVVAEGADAEEA